MVHEVVCSLIEVGYVIRYNDFARTLRQGLLANVALSV